MKKITALLAVLALVCGCLAGCGNASGGADDGKLDIVVTIFPVYDWVMNVVGDAENVNVTLLIDDGTDMHSYKPSADDLITIAASDVFIYVGGESDTWADDAVRQAVRDVNKDIVVMNLMKIMGDMVKEEEVVEGMQEEDEHDHHHDDDEDEDEDEHHHDDDEDEDEHHHDEDEEIEYDEHIWLSLRNAAFVVEQISRVLQQKDSANAPVYSANAVSYLETLQALDDSYSEAVSEASGNTILVGDRFPFRYLTDDYRIGYYAAFVGCSAESEASFETVTFLAGKVDELNLKSVLTIDGSDGRIAETIIQNTESHDQQILTLDSMQSVTAEEIGSGVTYLSVMESNLEVLKEALSY
ncbi:MAG: metal ABC transporter substrate-binding protein [Lachnospiraceae bacterium]|nr:metal ABC transporter substrate-binding protein [Lachnospiraceae bacterium]